MLLLGSEDENHKELHDRAKQIRYNPEDMVKVPGMDATFRLPSVLSLAEGLDFTTFYYSKLVRISLPSGIPLLTLRQAR